MGGGDIYLTVLKRYVTFEYFRKKKENIDWRNWSFIQCQNETPRQENSYDCGVFVCMFVHYLENNLEMNFTQRDIPSFRKHIAFSITLLS